MNGSGRLLLRNHKFLKIDHAKKQTSQIDITYPTSSNEVATSVVSNVASTRDSTMTTSSLNPDAPTFASVAPLPVPQTCIPRAFQQLQNFNKAGLKE